MPPKVLVVGSGGREHALTLSLAESPQQPLLFAAPGNPGTAQVAHNLPLAAGDGPGIVAACRRHGVDLVIVGPEDPLIDGLADRLRAAGITVFGPGAAGARLEGDKAWAKEVMAAAGVPTARAEVCGSLAEARAALARAGLPVVVKASGAAQGKGVAVCAGRDEAEAHLAACFVEGRFGAAGHQVLIEECLSGPELSVLAVTDGVDFALLAPARDHKRAGDGDTGPNTGGMGAFAPVAPGDARLTAAIVARVIEPTLRELRRRGIDYRGVLYAGLMLTAAGPAVLEYNCRFGDPETQAVLPLLRGDVLALLQAAAAGRLGAHLAAAPAPVGGAPTGWPGAGLTDWDRSCVVVVAAAPGYPGAYARGTPLHLPPPVPDEAWIVQAGTAERNGDLVTAGGRVLGAVGRGLDLASARDRAYGLLGEVEGGPLQYRTDIAAGAAGQGGG